MDINDALLDEISNVIPSECIVHIVGKEFTASKIEIKDAITPVTKRTQRGGVYFSDVMIKRAMVRINDKQITSLISQAMLGPNTEFADVRVVAKTKEKTVCLHTNLTNSMESADWVELSLTINEAELV